MGPGPPPLGPWGASRGVPGGGSRTQCPRARTWRALLVFVSFFISILMSIFDRLGVVLGSVLGVMFGHFGDLVGPSWSPNRLRIDLSSKKRFFTKHYVFQWFWTFFRPRWRPKTAQDRSKMSPRSSWIAFWASCIFASILDRFRFRFGAVLRAKMAPQGCRRAVLIDPWGDPIRC